MIDLYTYSPHDLMTRHFAQMVAYGTGLGENALEEMLGNSRDLISKCIGISIPL